MEVSNMTTEPREIRVEWRENWSEKLFFTWKN